MVQKKISENYEYALQVERIDIHPADFCRTYFNPLIQSNSSEICENLNSISIQILFLKIYLMK